MKSFARRIVMSLALLLAVLVVARGLVLTTYDPPTSDAYLWGAFHVHSTLSDGLGSFEEIARQAREARVAFLLMSDHGSPHEAVTDSSTINGVRFVGGSEIGLPEGRLIVSSVQSLPRYTLPPFPPDAARDVREWGGLAVLAYPDDPRYRWSYWEDDFLPDGIEVINVTSNLRAASAWRALTWAGFSLFNRHYYLTGLESPEYALSRWDELLARGDVVGFYASNAHGGFRIGERVDIPIPSYRTVLGFVGLGIDARYRDQPERAVRSGDFFSVVRGAGEPERFQFERMPDGRIRVAIEAAEELSPRVVLKKDGVTVAETAEGGLDHQPNRGVYRAEVYLEDHPLLAADVPWILSNSIRVDVAPQAPTPETLPCAQRTALGLDEFRVETDEDSNASIELKPSGALALSYSLSRATPANPERWVALALRRPLDLSASTGMYINASAPEPMRYRLEVRTASTLYHASVLIRESSRVTVPWGQFYRLAGTREPIPLDDVESLFIEVTDSTVRTGFDSTLLLDGVGICR
jgi:hypothetical protein